MTNWSCLSRRRWLGFAAALLLAGCSSYDDPLGSPGSASVYYGVGFHDPWYYGGYYDDPDIIVTPPTRPDRPDRPVAPTHPIARPPVARPMPSIPSTPRMGGRR